MAISSSTKGSLPIAGAYFTRDFGGKLIISDTAPTASCSADGTVTIPNTSNRAVWGYAKHEWFHKLWSDFEVLRRIGVNPLRFGIFMAIEDAFIERRGMAKWPGSRHSLRETVEWMKEIAAFAPVTSESHPAMILQGKILYWLRTHLLNQPLADLEAGAERAMQEVYPQGVNTRLSLLLRKAPSVSSTSESLQLADKILVMLKEEEQKEKERQQKADQSQGTPDQDPDQADGAGNSSPQPGDEAGQDSSANQSPDSSEADGSCPQAGSGSDQLDSSGGSSSAQQGDQSAIAQALAALDGDVMRDPHEVLKERLFAETEPGGDLLRKVPNEVQSRGCPQRGRALMGDVAKATSQVARSLANLVESHRERKESLNWRGERLDTKHLARVRTGVREVFVQTEDREEAFTSVHLLCDLSGSMSGREEVVARQATMALALALEAIEGVETAVTCFLDGADNPIRTVVDFGESARRNAPRFWVNAYGGTPLAEALWYAGWKFVDRLENRKIVMVVTDGDPQDPDAVRYVRDILEKDDVEIIGIGIKTQSVLQFFSKSIVINSVDELQSALFGVMRDRLTA